MSWASKRGFYAKSVSGGSRQDCPEGMSQCSHQRAALLLVSVQGLQMRRVRADFYANYESYVIKDKKKKSLDITPLLSSLICADKLQAALSLQSQNIWRPPSSVMIPNTEMHWQEKPGFVPLLPQFLEKTNASATFSKNLQVSQTQTKESSLGRERLAEVNSDYHLTLWVPLSALNIKTFESNSNSVFFWNILFVSVLTLPVN